MKISTKILAVALCISAFGAPAAALANAPVGKEVAVQEQHQVKSQSGGVLIEVVGDSSAHVTIYALTGQAVKQFDAAPGEVAVDLPSGYYIVKVGQTIVKVAVK